MRKIFSNMSEVAHIWAHQQQDEGRAGNVFFEGPTIYSYGRHFPIASFVTLPDGREVVQFTTRSYSVSTSKHISRARRAVSHRTLLFVNCPTTTPADNMEYEHGRFDAQLELIAATKHAGRIAKLSVIAVEHAANAVKIAEAWQIAAPAWTILDVDMRTRAANLATERAAIAAEREKARIISERAELRKARAYLKDWVNDPTMRTYGYSVPVGLNKLPPVCRINGNELETSHGARVLLDDVKSSGLWGLVQYCREHKAAADKPEQVIGNYRGVKIDANGNLTIGCHSFNYSEIARIAGILYEKAN